MSHQTPPVQTRVHIPYSLSIWPTTDIASYRGEPQRSRYQETPYDVFQATTWPPEPPLAASFPFSPTHPVNLLSVELDVDPGTAGEEDGCEHHAQDD